MQDMQIKSDVWKEVIDWEGLYWINDCGQVKSAPRNGNGYRGKILTPRKSRDGYIQVCLSKNGKCYYRYVHRLLAEAFIPNPLGLPCVNHKDEIKSNNYVSNLEWCDYKYNSNYGTAKTRNCAHRIQNNTIHTNIIMENISTHKTELFKTITDLLYKYSNLDRAHICHCICGKLKQYKGYKFYEKGNGD